MKKIVLAVLCWVLCFHSLGNHTRGGVLYYRYVSPGASPNTARYLITLKIYTECILSTNQFCPTVNISIFNAASLALVENVAVTYNDSNNIQNCTLQQCHPCLSPIPSICNKITTYEFTRDLPILPSGYIISYQRCCRIANIVNLTSGSSTVGDTWTVSIPGSSVHPTAVQNSSALFPQNDTAIICKENYFTYNFAALDPNNDSLVYEFTDAFTGPSGGTSCTGSFANPPPYTSVTYSAPFSGASPLGSGVTINAQTGLISGIAPSTAGTYVLTVMVSEYIRGTNIKKAEVRKSLHIQVADCSLTQAVLNPEYYSCDDSTLSFSNNSNSPNIQTYFWDFGVVSASNDTSVLPAPIFTYPDTGVYVLKLVVNRNLACSDSTTAIVKVYPGFVPGFTFAGQCKNTPIQFTDTSKSRYGILNFWRWNFGDVGSASNLSSLKNPTHIYSTASNYDVVFIVSDSKGCTDTVTKTVPITDKPALTVTKDTLICIIDTLQINAVGIGSFLWSPNYMINNIGSASPLVSPDIPTKYYVTLTDPYGCVGTDSVLIDVKSRVSLQAGNDTTLCQTDNIALPLISDGLKFLWTPATGLNDPTLKNPIANPLVSTNYIVIGSIGKCTAIDTIQLKIVPYPAASVGADTAICLGQSLQLRASGGTQYNWTPIVFLSAANIPNPISIRPSANVRYIVTVKDTLGCPKPVSDTLFLFVTKIQANAGPRDTTVVQGQPLLLSANGGSNYLWNPPQWLNNSSIANPISLPQNDIEYALQVSNAQGCFGYDSIRVKVFNVGAGLYVPTAFSPNGDGKNDLFRPILLGMKSLDNFKVYNRWGQMVYSNSAAENSGWDGSFGGREQASGTYIWFAEGRDYRDTRIQQKGYVVLIRH